MFNGRIYCITCLVNGKMYIGQTVQLLDNRWRRHVLSTQRGSDHKFLLTILSYGSVNFLVEEVLTVSAPTKEILKKKLDYVEMRLIKKLETHKCGYNSTDCGEGTLGLKLSEHAIRKMAESKKRENLTPEKRKRLSESKMGERNPFYQKTHTKEVRERISAAKRGENHHFFGKKMSEEHRKKLSEAQIKRRNRELILKL